MPPHPTGDPECEKTERGEPGIPDLIRYQLSHGPHAGEPTTERGEIERIARECWAVACHADLDSAVIETRFNVVRSSMPHQVTTVRRLGDYLPHMDQGGTPARREASLDEASMIVGAGPERAASSPPRSRLADRDVMWPDHLSLRARWHAALGGLLDGTLGFGWGRADRHDSLLVSRLEN